MANAASFLLKDKNLLLCFLDLYFGMFVFLFIHICVVLYICIFCIVIVRTGTFWCLVTSLRGPRHHLHNVYPEPDISSAEN